jgi:ABC-type transport system involved in cytochrome c biogenesis permease subunit
MAVHVFVTTLAYLTVFATGTIAACALVIGARGNLKESERQGLQWLIFRLTLTSSLSLPIGIVLGMFWAAHNLGRAWAWAPVEAGAAFALFSTLLLLLVQLRKNDDRLWCILATLGAISLAVGWFGANAVTSTAPVAWLCGALSVAQIVTLRIRTAK